jgi:hypothetical protein
MNIKPKRKKSYINPRHVLIALSLVAVASGAVLVLKKFSKPKVIKTREVVNTENEKVKKLIADCDALSKRAWDRQGYDAILSNIHAFQSTNLISASEAGNMENMARVAFANSLHIACENWRATDGTIKPNDLRKEVEAFYQFQVCKVILTSDKAAFDAYDLALTGPEKVDNFLRQKYESAAASNLYSFLQTNCQFASIAHFTILSDIFNQSASKLQDFRDYARGYDRNLAYYQQDPQGRSLDMKRNYCSDYNGQTSNYQYYNDQINSLGICY